MYCLIQIKEVEEKITIETMQQVAEGGYAHYNISVRSSMCFEGGEMEINMILVGTKLILIVMIQQEMSKTRNP